VITRYVRVCEDKETITKRVMSKKFEIGRADGRRQEGKAFLMFLGEIQESTWYKAGKCGSVRKRRQGKVHSL